jgi:hypothetical protein
MNENAESSRPFLAVIPMTDPPNRMPVVAAALEKVLTLFGRQLRVVCVTETGSYWWNGPKSKTESSRKIAEEASASNYAGLLLLLDAKGGRLPAGLMCWLEYFPDLGMDSIHVTKLLSRLTRPEKKHWLIWTNGSETFDSLHARLWRGVLSGLTHEQRN